jgi:hypothetical protein
LDQFYATTQEYSAFEQTQPRDDLYDALATVLRFRERSSPVRVLELGAGRTDFPNFLRRHGIPVHFTAQDVTPTNRLSLEAVCDRVVIGDIAEVSGEFDVVL